MSLKISTTSSEDVLQSRREFVSGYLAMCGVIVGETSAILSEEFEYAADQLNKVINSPEPVEDRILIYRCDDLLEFFK